MGEVGLPARLDGLGICTFIIVALINNKPDCNMKKKGQVHCKQSDALVLN